MGTMGPLYQHLTLQTRVQPRAWNRVYWKNEWMNKWKIVTSGMGRAEIRNRGSKKKKMRIGEVELVGWSKESPQRALFSRELPVKSFWVPDRDFFPDFQPHSKKLCCFGWFGGFVCSFVCLLSPFLHSCHPHESKTALKWFLFPNGNVFIFISKAMCCHWILIHFLCSQSLHL